MRRLAALALAVAPAGTLAQAPEAHNFTIKTDITYTQGVNGPLEADAYIPNGPGTFPGILFLHGGGWVDGSRSQMLKLIQALADKGYVGFTIDYDVAPVHFPASLNESFAALTYMRAHAAELHLDSAHIAVAGSSAGGELAALLALSPQTRTSPPRSIPPVQAAVILNGVLDLTAQGDKSSTVTRYLGEPCTKVPQACRDASPQSHVHPGAPAFFVGHGTADQSVPFAQAEAFVAALRAAKVQVHYFVAEGGPHTYWGKGQFYSRNLTELSDFLALTLHGTP